MTHLIRGVALLSGILLASNVCVPALATPTRPSAARSGQLVTVPGGLLVRVVIDSELSSAKATVHETFPVHAAEDVVLGGYVIVKAGAPGQGEVLTATAASAAAPGQLTYTLVYITGVDGKKIRLTGNSDNSHNTAADKSTRADASHIVAGVATDPTTNIVATKALSVVPIVGPFVGLVGGVGPKLFHSKPKVRDSVIAANTAVPSYVAATVHTFSNIPATGQTANSNAVNGNDYAK